MFRLETATNGPELVRYSWRRRRLAARLIGELAAWQAFAGRDGFIRTDDIIRFSGVCAEDLQDALQLLFEFGEMQFRLDGDGAVSAVNPASHPEVTS